MGTMFEPNRDDERADLEDAAAWLATLSTDLVDRIARETIDEMRADGLTIRPYGEMHDVCDPNQYLADVSDRYVDDEGRWARLVTLANAVTDRFDILVNDEPVTALDHREDRPTGYPW